MADVEWIDLVDPDEAELQRRFGQTLHPLAIKRLLEPAQHEDEPRPTIERHEDYVFGVILVAVAVPEEDRVFYQEIDIVLTHGLAAHGPQDAAGRGAVRHERRPRDLRRGRWDDRSRAWCSTTSSTTSRSATST